MNDVERLSKEIDEIKKLLFRKSVDELVGEKEKVLLSLEESKRKLDSGEIEKEDYESILREGIDRLAELDREIEESEKISIEPIVIGRISTEEVEELRSKIEDYRKELKESVKKLLEMDAKTTQEILELQKTVGGERMREVEEKIEKISDLYRDFVSEDRLQKLISKIKDGIKSEELLPLEGAVEKSLERIAELREEVREDAKMLEILERQIEKISDDFSGKMEKVSRDMEKLSTLSSQIAKLREDFELSRKRSVEELSKEKEKLMEEYDLLRGEYEAALVGKEEYEEKEKALKERIAEMDAKMDELRRTEEILNRVERQEGTLKNMVDLYSQVGKQIAELRENLSSLSFSSKIRSMEELSKEREKLIKEYDLLRGEYERGILPEEEYEEKEKVLKERIAEMDAKMDELRRTEEIFRKIEKQEESIRKLLNLGEKIREERSRIERLIKKIEPLEGEIGKEIQTLRREIEKKAESEDIKKLLSRIDERIELLGRENVKLRRELRSIQTKISEVLDSMRRDTKSLLRMKEEMVLKVEALRDRFESGLLSKEEFESQLREQIKGIAEIDARLDELARVESIAEKTMEHEKILKELKDRGEREREEPRERKIAEKLADFLESRIALLQREYDAKLEEQKTALSRIDSLESSIKKLLEEHTNQERMRVEDLLDEKMRKISRELRKLKVKPEEKKDLDLESRIERLAASMDEKMSLIFAKLRELSELRNELQFQRITRKQRLDQLERERERILASLETKPKGG